MIFANNDVNSYSPLLASGSAIGNPDRTIQHQLGMGFGSPAMPTFTTNFVMVLRQQMDEGNHDMVNMLTQQMDTIFNPLIQNMNQSYHELETQMNRITEFSNP